MGLRFLLFCVGFSVLGTFRSLGTDPSDNTYVRFNTNLGYIDVLLLTHEAPKTVANFQSYRSAYTNSVIHRSVPGFVIQGGGYVLGMDNYLLDAIPANAPVAGEAGVSNTRGTLAMALSNGPDSGTNQWFFNLVNNSTTLDGTIDGGPFTVFGVAANTNSLSVMDQIAGVPIFNFNSPLDSLPLLNYTTAQYNAGTLPTQQDFVTVYSITPLVVQNFVSWQTAKFTANQQLNAGFIAPTAIPFKDGVTNLQKYLCDINPSRSMSAVDRAKLPTLGKTTISGANYMTLTYQQNTSMVGVTVFVQTSPDLETWTTVTQPTIVQTGTDSSTGDPILQVLVPISGTSQFVRLNLAQSL